MLGKGKDGRARPRQRGYELPASRGFTSYSFHTSNERSTPPWSLGSQKLNRAAAFSDTVSKNDGISEWSPKSTGKILRR